MLRTPRVLVTTALLAGAVVAAGAVQRPPKAELTAVVDTKAPRAGGQAVLRLDVELPEAFHVQSDKPRDELLIPTTLTLTPPPGVTVQRIVYPPAVDFALTGQDEPLAVFEHAFRIEVHLALAADLKPGELVVPGRLRYQPCDASACYPPARADTAWTLTIAGR
jgi:hypothetical protein